MNKRVAGIDDGHMVYTDNIAILSGMNFDL
jgi:hypothetical protein